MAKVKLTAGRIAAFQCDKDKGQKFLWCNAVPGLGVRATASTEHKRYIFQAKVKGRSMRLTIGDVRTWSIEKAQEEARRLQVLIDQGNDPRQVKADIEAAKKAETAILAQKKARESVTVSEAWKAYIVERSSSIADGKPEWSKKHKLQHDYLVQPGGIKRTRGRRPNEPDITRPGILVPFMSMRLTDLDSKTIIAWLEKESIRAPAATALAFRILRAFVTWCTKNDAYRFAVNSEVCKSDEVKKKVPVPKAKRNDCLRRAQIQPWFKSVQKIKNPIISTYLQCLLLTGSRRNELTMLRWTDVDFKWKSLTIRDKVEGERIIPLTPFVEYLISRLPRRNKYVFSSNTSVSGRLEEPRKSHNNALAAAALPPLSLHGLRRSFSTLSEWVEVPAGIVAQIMGHKPSAIAEKHYIQRELDLLYLWHVKIEDWILDQADIKPEQEQPSLRIVNKGKN